MTGIGCIIFGLLLICFGAASRNKDKKARGTCTERITGKVIGYEESYMKDESGIDTWVFSPIFRYNVKGEPVETAADWGTMNPRYHEGQYVTLFYDPADPKKIYTQDNARTNGAMLSCIFFGIVMILAGILLLIP